MQNFSGMVNTMKEKERVRTGGEDEMLLYMA